MASPVAAVRQPLSTRAVNTPFFETKTAVVGQKRSHSQITGGQENLQTQILGAFKSPSRPTKRNVASRPTIHVQPPSQFKQPLPRAESKPRQRQQTNDPAQGQEVDSEMQEWRRSMKVTLSRSTFYFDGVEESFKEQATKWMVRLGGKVEQFFSNAVTIVVTSREMPSTHESPAAEETPRLRTTSYKANLHLMDRQEPTPAPVKDILIRARELGIKIWTSEKFKKILRALAPSTPPQSQPTTINPLHLSAALKAEKRTGRTTETDPSVPREEYVYFEGPYIIISDMAQVHKPIMVREYPEGSNRADGLWPMFWACKEGNCPFVRPRQEHKPADNAKHYARPNAPKPTLKENTQVVNRRDQPASGIVNSSNAFSAIRSTTTCGVTSALSGLVGAVNGQGSLSREVRELKSRLTPATNMPPPAKKRKVETLREQLAKTKPKKEKKEGYCENCKDRYDDYQEHTQTKRHRKYARNDKNFVDLDALLEQLRRPLLADEPDYIG